MPNAYEEKYKGAINFWGIKPAPLSLKFLRGDAVREKNKAA